MAAYRADIEIGVRGQRELERLRSSITQTTQAFESLNRIAAQRGALFQTLANYETQLNRAARAINNVALGSEAETKAIREYVTAMGAANAARSRQNFLIAQEIASRRRVQAVANAGFGIQGPQAAPIRPGRGPTSPIGGAPNIPGSPAAFRAGSGGRFAGRLGGAVSGSIIGGAFPLLFGQGGGAATGGAIGGLVGGLAGPGGSFAGSLLGTLLGDIASRGQAVKQLADDIGFSAQQTKQLSDAFKVANTDVEKFTAVIQNIRGLGLAIEDQAKAIQLVTRLTEAYGGSFEKTGNAITSALESGKVTQATLNQLTSQGINIQQALADKYKVSRAELLQMAKDGEISAQSLIDTLVEVANAGTTGATEIKSSYEETATAMRNAFANATTGINANFTSIQDTVVSAFDRMVKAMTPALVELAKISGQIVSLGAYITELGVKFASAFYSIPGTIQVVATALANMIPGLSTVYTTLSAIRNLRGDGGGKRGLATSLNLNAGMGGANWPAGIPRPGTAVQSFRVPSEFGPTGKQRKSKSDDEAKRRAEQLKKQLEYAARLAVETDYELQISYALTEQEKLQTAYDKDRLERMNKYETLYTNSLSLQEREYLITAQTNEINRANNEYQKARVELVTTEVAAMYSLLGVSELLSKSTQQRLPSAFGSSVTGSLFTTAFALDPNNKGTQQLDLYQKELDELTEKTLMAQQGAEGIGDAFSGAFQNLVTGTQTAQEALAGFFNGVAEAFMNMATEIIAKMITMYAFKTLLGLFGGGGGSLFSGQGPVTMPAAGVGGGASMFMPGAVSFRANGGPVTGGSPYIVGERGPELFVPGRSGTIVANDKLGGNGSTSVVVNVDASGSKVEGDDQQGKQLGRVIAAAVQQELIKQKRPGGLLV